MIWNSIAMMSVFDITIIVAVLFPLIILLKQRQQTRRSGLYRGLRTIVLGLLVLGSFYLVDLLTMYALPMIGPQTLSMQVMTSLHLNIHWVASLIGILVMAIGLSYLIWSLIPKLALDERMAFESLLSRISTRLINIPPAEFDDAFSIALREVGQHLEVDRGFLLILEPGELTMQTAHEWAAEGIPRLSAGDKYKSFSRKDLPWYFDRIVAGRTIAISCCAEHPDVAERRFCRDAGIKSEIGLPMIVDGSTIGCVGFEAVHSERVWTDSEVKQLELLAQMFAGALARQRADEALRESEFQLDKAQRIARIGHFIWDEIEGECAFRSAVLDDIVGLWDVQYRVVHPDGQVRNVHQVSSPEFDESGRLIRTVGTIQDITEMKLVEDKLRKSEALFSQAELMGGMGHWEWDETNERILACSDQFARIHEMTVDEVLARFSGREYERDVVYPDDLEHYRRCTREYRQLSPS